MEGQATKPSRRQRTMGQGNGRSVVHTDGGVAVDGFFGADLAVAVEAVDDRHQVAIEKERHDHAAYHDDRQRFWYGTGSATRTRDVLEILAPLQNHALVGKLGGSGLKERPGR